nr:ribonuclease H-like domain-containing protein [Tanacetum cinerariifolium]
TPYSAATHFGGVTVVVALQAPPFPDYIPGPKEPELAPPLPDYVPGLKHADDEIVVEDQPYAEDASPTAQSPEYVLESDLEAHPEEDDDEDPEEDPVDYLADGGDDGDDEEGSSKDDEDDDMDIKADEKEEEEHPAPADSVVVALPAVDQAPSAKKTEPFEIDESAATPYISSTRKLRLCLLPSQQDLVALEGCKSAGYLGNKPDLDTMSFDDLYNNFKIVEQEIKRTTSSNSSSSSQNMAFMSSPGKTREVNNVYEVNTSSSQVNTASTQVSTANLSDATVYAFLADQPNRSHLVHEDLKQIHKDDLKEMDLKWQLALLSMRARRFFQKTDTSAKAMVAIDGVGFDWSYMAEDEAPVNMALMDLSDSEIVDNNKKGLGYETYHVVSPPSTRLFSPPKLDLSHTSLAEFQQPDFKGYGSKTSENVSENISDKIRENANTPLVEKLVSDDKLDKKIVSPTVSKIDFVRSKQQEIPVRKPVKYALNNSNYNQRKKVVTKNSYTRVNYSYAAKKDHPSASKNIVHRAVLLKTGLRPLNTARNINTAHPKTIVYGAGSMTCFSKPAKSTLKRPIQMNTAYNNRNTFQKVNNANGKANTARPNSAVLNAVKPNKGKAIKASACWVWRPIKLDSALIGHSHKQLEDQGYFNSGCSKRMTGNISYLTDFKEFDGGYVAFGGGAKGGKNTRKGTIRIGKLDFEDMYFVKELQFNLFSVSQICDKKNNVLFTDTKCLVLSHDFKLADESHVLLKVPRKNNMYSFDMKNIVPKEGLTCLVTKATNRD